MRVAGVGAQGEPGSLEDFLGVDDGLAEGVYGRVCGPGDAGGLLLGAEPDDVAVEPDAVELGLSHVTGTRDAASAGGCSAEAVESLSHVPFGGGVEELAFRQLKIHFGRKIPMNGLTVSSSPGLRPLGPTRMLKLPTSKS